MVRFEAEIKKFGAQGEKTGWTYIDIPAEVVTQLLPGHKQSFRVKGKLDQQEIKGMALIPMGGGNFILPLKADLRRQIKKSKGAVLKCQLTVDKEEIKPPQELLDCLQDEPGSTERFLALPRSQRNYFIRWIESAKSEQTIAKRIAQTVSAMATGLGFAEMIREMKKFNQDRMP